MIIAISPNSKKKDSRNLAVGIQEFLTTRGVTVVAEDEEAAQIGAKPISEINGAKIDFLITMGGDGTILRLAHKYADINPAIIGINLGHLGFMADIPVADIYPSLQDILEGNYKIDERLIIEGESMHGERCFAINDIVVQRGINPNLVEIAIHVDDTYVNTFEADGVIVATPNGSTAYSLAAGGPILTPDLDAIVLTPICPHTISNRPLVLTAHKEIQIQYLSDYEPLEIRADGLTPTMLKPGEVFRIRRSDKTFRLVSLPRHDYYATLRTKLGWVGKLRHPSS